MAVTPLKVFLFLFGCTAAAGAVAYGTGSLDPLLGRAPGNPAAVAALPEPPPSDPAAPKGERVNEPPADPGTMMAAVPPADDAAKPPATDAQPPAMAAEPPPAMAAKPPADQAATPPAETPPAAPQPPTFDVVRVEADGSVVVAGKAFADALVELLDGQAVLGSAKATPEGDFAIVLDERLKPGDYQLTLRATPPGGAAIASLQTAVLSIPDKPGGQVLAMVEEPGQASDILTVPQPDAPSAPKTDEAATPPAGQETPADVASNPPADQPKAGEAGQEEKPADVASAPADANPPKAPEAANEQKPADDAGAPAKPAEVAAAPPQPAEQAPRQARVAVEAVEIDGGKIFVAGIGDPGRFVRVYANEIVLGETKVSEGGRFLIEAKRDLPVGSYVIRADLLDADGVKVIARATVPFEREPGESIAAVAPVEPPADKPADVAAADKPPAANEPPPAAAAEPSPPAEPAPNKPEQPALAANEPPPAGAAAEPPPPAEAAPKPEQPAVAANEPPPADSAAAESPPPAEAAPKPEQPAVAANEPPPADGVAADKPPAEQPPAVAAAEPPATGSPPETVSPKLEKVEGAVIIRRSDTLWRISRRVYGRGIRYWTIYLANQSQISNPDKIWPGQVFRVPDKSKEGEAADMSAMGNQVTTVTPQ